MSAPSDKIRLLIMGLFAMWLVTFLFSFVAYAQAPHEAAGFPDGLNKPKVYLGWQGVAGMLAVAVFGVGRQWPKGSSVRGISNIPIILALLQIIAIFGIMFWAGDL